MTSSPEIRGVFCAATTALNDHGNPDHIAFAQHCKALLDEGCHGIALLGSTGEATSFGLNERKTILENCLENGISPDHLLPGTGLPSIADTIDLTRHAMSCGVRGVLVLPPFYYKAVNDEGLYRFYADLIEGTGSDRLKIILYHIPPIAGIGLSHDLIARLLADFPGIVVGIKDSSGDIENMRAMVAKFPTLSVLAGADPFLHPLLEAGGAGCITASSNLIARDLRFVFDHCQSEAHAEAVKKAQERIVTWRTLTNAYVQLPTVKAMVARRRNNETWLRVRPPFVELSDSEREDVWNRMAELEEQDRRTA
jgi:4-hydroxy-tetrahydrodipicolinate synthase